MSEERKLILNAYDNWENTNARNSMGCSEDWYCYPYAISRTFTRQEVENMSDETISLLVKLAGTLADAFY